MSGDGMPVDRLFGEPIGPELSPTTYRGLIGEQLRTSPPTARQALVGFLRSGSDLLAAIARLARIRR